MKNWGVRIILIYSAFVIGILTMVTMAMNQNIELVSEDYYAKELKFQEQINHSENALDANITSVVNKNTVTLHFPVEFHRHKISGTALFFKPSDSKKDLLISIACNDQGTQVIQSDKLEKGMYKMKINWEVNQQKYYQEKVVVLN